ncbi:neutral/alkaline ceramidase [Turneriella parva]|uniref:Neutral ceramidase n=1 Tax=Turneriella parva (strain ATCC BAA-1111 / DSM 21527 / NCTC 11395 / H) TaxID=869212 RepID=I4B0X9_TURPD|nr:neutral/alkaline ceramidase [Turneriella parva]AFM10936.1 Neutral/alkaline nonlysosomal ceramidase [Turneriella parva DSM 21527]
MSERIAAGEGRYEVGCGIYDVTGPAAEVGMMGFAEVAQTTQGIYMRLWSRAFIIGDGQRRIVYVCADLCMIYQAVKQAVAEKVSKDAVLKDHYNDKNILISATHTHSGPGGYSHHFLYNLTTKGFIPQNFDAIVEGIYQSIRRAHANLEPAQIYMARGRLDGYGFNRATRPYAMNPAEERERYGSDLDNEMTLLKFVALEVKGETEGMDARGSRGTRGASGRDPVGMDARGSRGTRGASGRELGMINWLGVHPTSVGPANRLIGGDHKGLAEYWFEKSKNADFKSDKPFVAAFALAPAGDVSPNLWGVADGIHDYEHMEIIARKQYEKAVELYETATEVIQGPVDARHRYVDFSRLHIDALNVDTVPAAMGASFLAGSTEDNESQVKVFHEGVTVDSLQGNERIISSAIDSAFGAVWPKTLSEDFIKGHAPKKILVPTGLATFDGNPWTPQILPVQVVRLGQLAIAAQPTEITTMAGRRIVQTLQDVMAKAGITHAVVASHSNAYSSYVTTREEYAGQEYEGASTHFGPYTLEGFQQEFARLGAAIAEGSGVPQGVYPKDYRLTQLTLQPGVVYDAPSKGRKFGDVLVDAAPEYQIGSEVVVEFQSAHPRNDLMTMQDFALVQRKTDGGDWVDVCGDRDPQLTFTWQRLRGAESKAILRWKTQSMTAKGARGAEPGEYRLVHRGVAKAFWFGRKTRFEGVSRVFRLV